MTIRELIKEAAKRYNTTVASVLSESRARNETTARHLVAVILRDTGWNYEDIAKALNRTDHTTSIYAVKRIRGLIQYEEDTRANYMELMQLYAADAPRINSLVILQHDKTGEKENTRS